MQFFRAAIIEGRLAANRRLPSSRDLADELNVSRSTAIGAYDRLLDEGYLYALPRAGIFVSGNFPELCYPDNEQGDSGSHAFADSELQANELSDSLVLLWAGWQLPLAPGLPAIDYFPWSKWAKVTAEIYRERPMSMLHYSNPLGEMPLRAMIANYLGVSRGVVCDPEQVIVFNDTERMLQEITHIFGHEGDTAWIEDPCYTLFSSALRAAGIRPVAIPVDDEGIDFEEGLKREPNARLALVSPSISYPLGRTMSLARRCRLIEWMETSGAWLIETDVNGDYRYDSRPLAPLYALAQAPRVIFCGSLGRLLAPGLRINYAVAPRDATVRFMSRPPVASVLTQLVFARFDARGYLASHMRTLRVVHARRREVLRSALSAEAGHLLKCRGNPECGLHLVADLPVGTPDKLVARHCLEAGIKVNPLSIYYANNTEASGLIIGFASTPDDQILPAVKTLRGVLEKLA